MTTDQPEQQPGAVPVARPDLLDRVTELETSISSLEQRVSHLEGRHTKPRGGGEDDDPNVDASTGDLGVHLKFISPSRLQVTWKPVQGLDKECGVYLQREDRNLRFRSLEPVTMKSGRATAEFDLGLLSDGNSARSKTWKLIYTDSNGDLVTLDVTISS